MKRQLVNGFAASVCVILTLYSGVANAQTNDEEFVPELVSDSVSQQTEISDETLSINDDLDPFLYRGDGYVVIDASKAKEGPGGSRFFPTGKLDPSVTVVIAEDGVDELVQAFRHEPTLSEVAAIMEKAQLDEPEIQPMATHSYVAYQGHYGAEFVGSAVMGMNDSTRVYYGFNVHHNTTMQACGKGLGYYQGYNGSEMGVWQSWYGLGCTSTTSYGSAGASVPWGNVMAVKKFKAASTGFMATGSWW